MKNKKKRCPPHRYPHTWPWGNKVTDEECHSHESRFWTFWHDLHCGLMKCPHAKKQKNRKNKSKKKKKR